MQRDVQLTGRNWPTAKVPTHEEILLKVRYVGHTKSNEQQFVL